MTVGFSQAAKPNAESITNGSAFISMEWLMIDPFSG
jgi:hypothetical protein